MLKTRVITAALLIPLVLAAIFLSSHVTFFYISLIVYTLASWEWSRLSGIQSLTGQIFYAVFYLFIAATIYYALGTSMVGLMSLLVATLLFWGVGWLAIFTINRQVIHPDASSQSGIRILIKLLIGLCVLIPPLLAMNYLRAIDDNGATLLLFAMLLVWIADSGAYFSGRAWGKHKLARNVSPGKSWEGVSGAFVLTIILAIVSGLSLSYTGIALTLFVIVCALTVWFSILGDLFISLFKRLADMKDSSHLIPGHGGILDRIDSLNSALPVFLLGLLFLDMAS